MRWQFIFFLIIILLLGALLRLDRLGERSLWYDEIMQMGVSENLPSLPAILFPSLYTDEVDRSEPKLSHWILRRFISKYGETAFVIRLPFFITGVLSITLIGLVGGYIFGYKEGLIAALLLAISPYHIYFSQEARPYALVILLTICSLYFFYRLLFAKDMNLFNCVGLLVVTSLNMATSFLSFYVISIEALFVCIYFLFNKKIHLKTVFIGLCLVGAIGAIFRGFIFSGVQFVVRHINSGHEVRFLTVNWSFFYEILKSYLAAYSTGLDLQILLFLNMVLFVVGIIAMRSNKWLLILFTIWICLPFVLVFTIFKPFFYFNPRYLIFILPVVLLIIAKGFVWLLNKIPSLLNNKHKLMYMLSVGLVIALNVKPLINYHCFEKDDWKGASEYLSKTADDKDLILVPPWSNYVSFNYYSSKETAKKTLVTPYFEALTICNDFFYVWMVNYLDEDWYWRLQFKGSEDDYAKYKRFRENIVEIENIQFNPHPKVIKAAYLGNKYVMNVDLSNCKKNGVLFNKDYNILQPECYNKKGYFSCVIKSRGKEFCKAYLKIVSYVVYKSNNVLIKVPRRIIKNTVHDDRERRETDVVDVTDLLQREGEFILKGFNFSDSSTSKELFDSRIESIEIIYGDRIEPQSEELPDIYKNNIELIQTLRGNVKYIWRKEDQIMALDLKEFKGVEYNEEQKCIKMFGYTNFCCSPLIKLREGTYVVEVDAFGDICEGIFPLYEVDILWRHKNRYIKAKNVAKQYVNGNANTYTSNEFICDGEDKIVVNVRFLNDAYRPDRGEDRNLYINSLRIKKIR